ncbi:MAG TPA: hypothetical protein VNF75_03960 [Candidatus Dormibacteraeota bacterium]|nr:hypothetical protein [Candidatus Dormibacteraeota bacterium]
MFSEEAHQRLPLAADMRHRSGHPKHGRDLRRRAALQVMQEHRASLLEAEMGKGSTEMARFLGRHHDVLRVDRVLRSRQRASP